MKSKGSKNVVLREPEGCSPGLNCKYVKRSCKWVGQNDRCSLLDKKGRNVGDICVVQCNRECNRTGTLFPSVQPQRFPTRSPSLQPRQTTLPTSAPVTKTTSAPVQTLAVGIPPGPYVTTATSSERVVIPRPPKPNVPVPPFDCPHTKLGLKRWYDQSTWIGGKLPIDGENVTIPVGYRVLVDQSVKEKLGVIEIPPTSALIFGSNTSGITFAARGFNVLGELIAGSETCMISTPITITLHGLRPVDAVKNPPPTTYKGIVVSGGTLSLHGARFYHTWTRLAKTVNPGDNILLLQEPVNWRAGQQIVVVTSAMKDSRDFNKNEVLTIKSVIGDATQYGVGAIVYLTSAAVYQHIANNYYQVEVGLLTRFIKVQGGADDSEPVDKDPLDRSCMDPRSTRGSSIYFNTTQPCMDKHRTGFGGHIRIEQGGTAQVEGVELYRMGQTNVMGRYPMHFHLLGNCPACYFKYSSVHRSFYRCISIHGTHSSMTTENVAYDIIGFCYYLEDGIEQFNTISFNLAAHVHMIGPSIPWADGHRMPVYVQNENLTLPADVSASGFYITNVNNTIIGNAASGVSYQ
jgi:G8 domain